MENKSSHAIYLAAIIALGVVYLIEVRTNEDGIRAKDAELKSRLREKEELYRTLEERYEITKDSLDIAFSTIKFANFERIKAEQKAREAMRKYNDIKFVRYESDTARNNALKQLYRSYTP